jgi:hypothetical protein
MVTAWSPRATVTRTVEPSGGTKSSVSVRAITAPSSFPASPAPSPQDDGPTRTDRLSARFETE